MEQLAMVDAPELLFHAQRLVGAVSSTAYWMSLQDDPTTKAMGERLLGEARWFYGEEDKWDRPPTLPPKSKP
jgi:hypothetical protein